MQPASTQHEITEAYGDHLRHLKIEMSQRLWQQLEREEWQSHKLFTITLSAPALNYDTAPPSCDSFFWRQPENGDTRIGLGEALRLTSRGKLRFPELISAFSETIPAWGYVDPDGVNLPPSAFAAFSFDEKEAMQGVWEGFPNAAIFIPELMLQQTRGRCALSFSTTTETGRSAAETLTHWMRQLDLLLEASSAQTADHAQRCPLSRVASSPSNAAWMHLVESAITDIRAGHIEKVVPAKSIRVKAGRTLDHARLLSKLCDLHPRARLFSVQLGDKVFTAATPERLVQKRGQNVVCDAVGGTAGRDSNAGRDSKLGDALLGDSKSLHEHQLVVQEIRAKLAPVCNGLSYTATPTLMPLRNLQHLSTQFHGTLSRERPLMDLAAALHPTAAVNGYPAEEAAGWLGRNETFARGWFAGAGGWLDRNGDGELAVLLRCALIEGEYAELFAGAGITSGSDPAAELAETELKFDTMLEALSYA